MKQEFGMKEELTIKQLESLNNTLEKSSADLEEWQGRSDELADKLTAQNKEISAIKNDLVQKSKLLDIKLANIDILTYQLSEKNNIIYEMKARYELNNTMKDSKTKQLQLTSK